jgi:hypothetical protein
MRLPGKRLVDSKDEKKVGNGSEKRKRIVSQEYPPESYGGGAKEIWT